MGILNINAQSFYDGGRYTEPEKALARAQSLVSEGADIIDLGPASSKPGSALISAEQEWQILEPSLRLIRTALPDTPLSIDTYNADTAEKALQLGADMINDISGAAFDARMPAVIGAAQVPYVMMHLRGTPANMQENTRYDDLMGEITRYFSEGIEQFYRHGAHDLILDPGLGFGKTRVDNYRLLQSAAYFERIFDLPVLIGASRKSMLYKLLDITAEEALNASSVAHSIALMHGARLLRVHDPAPAVEVRRILTYVQKHAACPF